MKEVLFFDLSLTPIEEIKEKYQKDILATEEFWNIKKESNYATLIFIDKITALSPFKISKVGMQS